MFVQYTSTRIYMRICEKGPFRAGEVWGLEFCQVLAVLCDQLFRIPASD